MTETLLKSLIRLFSLITSIKVNPNVKNIQDIVSQYLKLQIQPELIEKYIQMFDFYLENQVRNKITEREKLISTVSMKIIIICNQINDELHKNEKYFLLIRLIEIINTASILPDEFDLLKAISLKLNIDEDEFFDTYYFVLNKTNNIYNTKDILYVNSSIDEDERFRNKKIDGLKGQFVFKFTQKLNLLYFKYIGNDVYHLNNEIIEDNKAYFFDKASSISGNSIHPIYYFEIIKQFLKNEKQTKITLYAKEIEYQFRDGEYGVRKFSMTAESGQLMGIMGNSGVGKSTLLNILGGMIQPTTGEIFYNGYNLSTDYELIKQLIGYVSQDNLLIDQLTVYENLYYTTKLCFNKINEEQIESKIDNLLDILDLKEVKNLIVGNPLDKFLSGGQRKRLNIGLEILRNPCVLFVDEPTSGLSSHDSEKIMQVLKKFAYNGKLVIVNIHQPSSEIFKLFDSLLILDKGGKPIYSGNPVESIVYFNTVSKHVDANKSECSACGNIKTDQVLSIVESKEVDEQGEYLNTRKISSEKWYELFIRKNKNISPFAQLKTYLPEKSYTLPSKLYQFVTFLQRTYKANFKDKQYLLVTLLEAPLLAIILSVTTRGIGNSLYTTKSYLYYYNDNIPTYLFMSVVVFLFLGMTLSAEEILKDRKILKRESFINLNRLSYISSKVIYVFAISLFQVFIFVVFANLILEIKGMLLLTWIILLSIACFANVTGLLLSSAFKSAVTIYILIPLFLIPQLILSGATIKYENIYKPLNSQKHVPLVGDLMASRWAYEALMVGYYRYNNYQKHVFNEEKLESKWFYYSKILIPELQNIFHETRDSEGNNLSKEKYEQNLKVLANEISELKTIMEDENIVISDINYKHFNETTAKNINNYLNNITRFVNEKYEDAQLATNNKLEEINKELGKTQMNILKEKSANKALTDLVKNKTEITKIKRVNSHLFSGFEPIYMESHSNYIRAKLFVSEKKLGGFKINTIVLNIVIIWIMTFIILLLLYYDVLRKLIQRR